MWVLYSHIVFCVPPGFIAVYPNHIADKKLDLGAILMLYSEFSWCLNINMGRTIAAAAKNFLSTVEYIL